MSLDYLQELEENREEMIRTLQESVRIPSVQSEGGMTRSGEYLPFGANVEAAYQHMMETGRAMGFDTMDVDHYAGHIEWKAADSKETFGIAAHLDVVPEGNGWEKDPYCAEIEDGWMYGRGTTDDKGPLVACLYAMKALKDAGYQPKKNIRLILGLDEETGSESIERYLEAAGIPDKGITPDSEFPLINGEMGILIFDLAAKMRRHNPKEGLVLSKMNGGDAPNIVPGTARAVVASADKKMYDHIREMAETYSRESGMKVKTRKVGSSLAIEAQGFSAHGATPERGLNAVSILMDFLGRLTFAGEELNEFIEYYNSNIGFCLHGENIGCHLNDAVSGDLIFNVGIAEINEDFASVTVNIRYPVTCREEDVYQGIERSLEGTRVGLLKKTSEGPVYLPADDPFAVQLVQAYVDETGDTEHTARVDSGGTYAKAIPGTFAFGALFPGGEDRMHQANERLLLSDFDRMARIYARMLYALCVE